MPCPRFPPGIASMLWASTPLIVAILAQALFARKGLTMKTALGLLIGFRVALVPVKMETFSKLRGLMFAAQKQACM